MSASPPTFCIRLESRGAHTVVTMEGELDLASRDQLRNHFQWFIADAAGDVDLDLAAVTYIESTGLGEILSAHAMLRDQFRTLRVVKASPQVVKLFEICGISELLVNGHSLGLAASPRWPDLTDRCEREGCGCLSDFDTHRETPVA